MHSLCRQIRKKCHFQPLPCNKPAPGTFGTLYMSPEGIKRGVLPNPKTWLWDTPVLTHIDSGSWRYLSCPLSGGKSLLSQSSHSRFLSTGLGPASAGECWAAFCDFTAKSVGTSAELHPRPSFAQRKKKVSITKEWKTVQPVELWIALWTRKPWGLIYLIRNSAIPVSPLGLALGLGWCLAVGQTLRAQSGGTGGTLTWFPMRKAFQHLPTKPSLGIEAAFAGAPQPPVQPGVKGEYFPVEVHEIPQKIAVASLQWFKSRTKHGQTVDQTSKQLSD